MPAFPSFLKALLIPLLISTILYSLLFHLLLPLYRRHHARYSHYLPLAPPTANHDGHSSPLLHHRLAAALRDFLPSFGVVGRWVRPLGRDRVVDADDDYDDADEELDDAVWDGVEGRRDALEGQMGHAALDRRRLSRDLEEGFRDSSDDEDGGDEDEQGVQSRRSR